GQTDEHIGALKRLGQRTLVGFGGKYRLVLVQIVTTSMDHTLAVDHVDVFDLGSHAHQQLHAGRRRSASAQADDLCLLQGLTGDLQSVEHAGRGNDGGTVLVIVEHRNVALLDQGALDLEALRRLDVFQIDATEGDGNALDRVDQGLRAFGVDF